MSNIKRIGLQIQVPVVRFEIPTEIEVIKLIYKEEEPVVETIEVDPEIPVDKVEIQLDHPITRIEMTEQPIVDEMKVCTKTAETKCFLYTDQVLETFGFKFIKVYNSGVSKTWNPDFNIPRAHTIGHSSGYR